jgi:hypothetical protein
MRKFKEISQRIPGALFVYYLGLKLRSTEDIFTDIYIGNKWGEKDSVSGPGSVLQQTRIIIDELPAIFVNFNIHSVLDIPCGDFRWMNHVRMKNIDYTGADIVMDLVQNNKKQYEKGNVQFSKLNLIKDKLPRVDLIVCRDCLVHLSFKDIFWALRNVCHSNSTYLLTTTFPGRQHTHDIATGQWRTLNLEAAPFMLPPPLKTINEECTLDDGAFEDKSLGLWRVADIRGSLTKRSSWPLSAAPQRR